jgi:hypothetical protein
MKDVKQTRFIATNYYNLQGLRMIPLGLCLVLVVLWANGIHGPTRDFLVPILVCAGSVVLVLAIDRYYLHTFGRVQRTPESRHLEWLIGIIGGILALGAFVLDVSVKLPVSALGLVFSAGLAADYIRMTWLVNGRFLLYYPLGAILMAGVSILPLLGLPGWWLACGLKNQIIGIAMAIGIFTMIAGIWGHIFLVRTLPLRQETNHDHAI